MKLVNNKFNFEIVFKENFVNVLCIENPEVFSDVVVNLHMQSNGDTGNFVLSEIDNILKIDKEISLVLEPVSLSINDRKVLTRLHTEIKVASDNEFVLEYADLNSKIVEYLDNLILKVPYMVTFAEELDILGLLKLFQIRMEENYNSMCEKIISYIKLYASLCKVNTFIFLNLKSYLGEEELNCLYKEAFYCKVNILLIENCVSSKLDNEIITVIDKDLCIIRY